MLKLVILGAPSPGLVDRILRACADELVQDQAFRIGAELVGEEKAVRKHVRELVANAAVIGCTIPLEALQELTGFDRDALRKILRTMELSPITLTHKLT